MAWQHRVVDHIVEHLAATGVDYIFVTFVAGLREQPRRAGQRSRHRRAQRLAERRGVVLGGVGVTPAGNSARRHYFRAAGSHRRPHRRARGGAAPEERSAGLLQAVTTW